jgi:hypothetical protein
MLKPSGVIRRSPSTSPALLTSTSIRPSPASRPASPRTCSSEARSAISACGGDALTEPSPAAAASVRPRSRPTRTTVAPSPARAAAAAFPIPDVAPVTTQTLPFMPRMLTQRAWPSLPVAKAAHRHRGDNVIPVPLRAPAEDTGQSRAMIGPEGRCADRSPDTCDCLCGRADLVRARRSSGYPGRLPMWPWELPCRAAAAFRLAASRSEGRIEEVTSA